MSTQHKVFQLILVSLPISVSHTGKKKERNANEARVCGFLSVILMLAIKCIFRKMKIYGCRFDSYNSSSLKPMKHTACTVRIKYCKMIFEFIYFFLFFFKFLFVMFDICMIQIFGFLTLFRIRLWPNSYINFSGDSFHLKRYSFFLLSISEKRHFYENLMTKLVLINNIQHKWQNDLFNQL